MTKKLTPESEAKLLRTIEKTAALVNSGTEPNEAIVKAAQDVGIPPGHISLVVHAYNTGRTNRQLQEGGDPFEKSADFPLADTATVLELLYPSQVKTAAEQRQDTAVSTDYALTPDGILERREKRAALRQVEARDWTMVPAPEPYPRDGKHMMKKAHCDVERGKRAVEESRRQKAAAFDKMASTFRDITNYFREPTCLPVQAVRRNAELLHGAKGAQIIDQVMAVSPGLFKTARHTSSPHMTRDATERASGAPYTLVEKLLGETVAYKESAAAFEKLAADTTAQAEVLLRPFYPRPSRSILEDPSSPEKSGAVIDTLGQFSLAKDMFGATARSMAPSEDNKLINKTLANLTDPEHEAKIHRIQSQAVLHDLMLNDPVISGHDPQDATDAYNDIVQASPRAATQRGLLQSMMRKRLQQGQLDQFDYDSLYGMDVKMRKQEIPPSAISLDENESI